MIHIKYRGEDNLKKSEKKILNNPKRKIPTIMLVNKFKSFLKKVFPIKANIFANINVEIENSNIS
ncbi:hypothetical protein [Candidatus Pelagibacter sp. HIMB1611]|uniref:hypothetical protein n=1 Tax=Candidatus Pelagibacter sp. HIMB1611 TaxID=3413357 RepID=UPI003F840790